MAKLEIVSYNIYITSNYQNIKAQKPNCRDNFDTLIQDVSLCCS